MKQLRAQQYRGTGLAQRTGAWLRGTTLLLAGLLTLGLVSCGSTSTTSHSSLLPVGKTAPVDVTVTPFDRLNSPGDDFGLTMPLDTTLVFFTSSYGDPRGAQLVYYSRQRGGTWSPPLAAVEINNGRSNGTPSIVPGATTMYFAGDEYGLGDCDIYSVNVGPRGDVPDEAIPWSVPSNLGMQVNGVYWDSEPCISNDGSILYFASDRPGGFGGRDIWFSRRKRDGTWNTPINAGERINTSYDEVTPWLSPDGATLFFSSNGFDGLGGFDVFAATAVAGVTRVGQLAAPVNSEADDICFTISSDGSHSFLASNRAGGRGGLDLYRVHPVPEPIDPLLIVRGTVREGNGRPLPGVIEVSDLVADQVVGIFQTDPESGEYQLALPRGVHYGITAQAPGYLFNSMEVHARAEMERTTEIRLDITLAPADASVRLLVFFATGQSSLLRESMVELDRVVDFMNENPEILIELTGHADGMDDPAIVATLARDRAQAVKSFLVANRINPNRITVKGGDTGVGVGRYVEMRVAGER